MKLIDQITILIFVIGGVLFVVWMYLATGYTNICPPLIVGGIQINNISNSILTINNTVGPTENNSNYTYRCVRRISFAEWLGGTYGFAK